MLRLIGVGDNTVDTYIQSRVRYPGGNAVNVAVLSKRYGIETAYLGSLGNDARGRLVLDSLVAEGVETTHCKVHDDVENAYVEVSIIDGDRVFGRYASGAAALLTLTAEDLAYIQTFDIVHSSIYSFLEDQADELRAASRFLSVDFSSDLNEVGTIQHWLPLVDLAICSISDHPALSVQQVAEDFKRQGAGLVLITEGMNGSWVYDGMQMHHQEVIPVQVVDTMGAGDAYIGAFLVELMNKTPIPDAMKKAAQYAAISCQSAGAYGYAQPY